MVIPNWLPAATWFVGVALVGIIWLVVDIRFRRAHQRRYRAFRSDAERLDLFARSPSRFLKEEPGQWLRRLDAYSLPVDDRDIELLRRASLALFATFAFAMVGGYFVSLLLFGAIRRIADGLGLLIVPQVAIIGFWSGFLIWLLRRDSRSRAAALLIAAALFASITTLFVTLALTAK